MTLAWVCAVLCGSSLWITNEASGDITIVDETTGSVLAHVPVGKRPRGIRFSRDRKLAFVAVSGSPNAPPGTDESTLPPPDHALDGIAVIDVATRAPVRTLKSGTDPETFDLSPDGKALYVANEDAATLSFVDVASGAVRAQVPVGPEPEGVTVDPAGRFVYVTSEQAGAVYVIDVMRRQVAARIATGARPRSLVFSKDGGKAYVANEGSGSITVLDAVAHVAVKDILLGAGARPMGTALSPDGATLFVSTGRGGAVAVVDTQKDVLVRTVKDVGARVWGLAVSVDGARVFTANGPSGDLSIVDVKTGEVLRRISSGGSPWGVALLDTPERRQLRVCADPNNLPFSDEKERGFENGLAHLLARELDADVVYTWWPQHRGFFRNTLNAKRCDVVMGVPVGLEMLETTEPYYRSSYVFAYGPNAPHVKSLDAPELRTLRIGVQLVGDDGATPAPALVLADHGLVGQLRGYTVFGDYADESPSAELIRAVGRGDVDVAIAWGPMAGYFASRASPPLAVAALPAAEAPKDMPFSFDIALGVRHGDHALKKELNAALKKRRGDIDRLLTQYNVPRS